MSHPLATIFVGLRTRIAMRDAGFSRSETRDTVGKLQWEHVERAAKTSPAVAAKWATAPPLTEGDAEGFGAPGDHPFIEWLVAFLNSPEGHALIQFLIALLMGL